jgi:hypothetical protein
MSHMSGREKAMMDARRGSSNTRTSGRRSSVDYTSLSASDSGPRSASGGGICTYQL